ncbi:MAG: hypothetical protein IPK07_28840 [Deltaproteobacteria bacterium]|nr:hypothetical protein [Deltaproteobacteria bacterium]
MLGRHGFAALFSLVILAVVAGCGDSGGGNRAPVADAGADREVAVGGAVQLDGTASADPDGDPLTYLWTLTSRPAGSAAAISDAAAPQPGLVADVAGVYELALVVSDGVVSSVIDTVTLTAVRVNARPQARAGADQVVQLGSVVELDATGSGDPDGDQLAVTWTLTAKPAGSNAGLKDPAAAKTVFVADALGTFRVTLAVDDGSGPSEPDEVVIEAVDTNVPPTASAGEDQAVPVGTVVPLNGSASHDDDGDAIVYQWSIKSKPAGSVAGIKDPGAEATLFVADVEGQFEIQLIVNDGQSPSVPDVMVVTASRANSAPTATAGADQSVRVGDTVVLDGSGSTDPDGNPLAFSWSFLSRPGGSAAVIGQANGVQAGFIADVAGQYVVRLVVSDGQADSTADTVTIAAGDGSGGADSSGCADPGSTLLCDALAGATTGNRDGGSFVSSGGWTPGWNIEWDLGQTLAEGAFSADLGNWDTSTSSPQHRHSKQHILNMYQEGHGSAHTADEHGTGFWNLRTGRDYNGLFKFLSSTRGFDERGETRLSPPGGRLDPTATHSVRVEFQRGGNATVFLDGRSMVTQPHPRSFQLRYVLVGSDNSPGETYGPQSGVIYKNIKVWGSTSGGRMIAANLSVQDGRPVIEEVPQPEVGVGLLAWLKGRWLPLATVVGGGPR